MKVTKIENLSTILVAPEQAPGDLHFIAGAAANPPREGCEGGAISFVVDGIEHLRLAPDGVYVRGEPAPNSEGMYEGFRDWLDHAVVLHGADHGGLLPDPNDEELLTTAQALHWIARLGCERAPEDDLTRRLCIESGDGPSLWCGSCFAQATLRAL